MITIKRGGETRTVTTGAFANFYEAHGWKRSGADVDDSTDENLQEDPHYGSGMKLFGSNSTALEDDPDDEEDEEPDQHGSDQLTDEEILEIPVSDMKTRQLKRAAKIIGYDYKADGVKKTKILREKMTQLLAQR